VNDFGFFLLYLSSSKLINLKNLLIIGAASLTFITSAQEVVSSNGESYSNANGSIDYTVGEVVTMTGTNGTNDITQGFHQTNWNFLSIEDNFPTFKVDVYPNPLQNEIHISSSEFTGVSFTLYDAEGKIIATDILKAVESKINVNNCAPGIYSLVLQNSNQVSLKTFKLLKAY
jgi:hypothetical protein